MNDPNWSSLPKVTDYVNIEDTPSLSAFDRVIGILDNFLDMMGACPLHINSDEDADECTCRDEAEIIMVRDWLKIQKIKDR